MQATITQKLREQFSSMAIYKDPVSTNSLFAGRNLPSFVKDFILKRFINGDGSVNRAELTNFLDMVIPQKQTEVKDRLASGEELTLLTRFIIYIDLVKGLRRFGIPDLGIKINEGQIPEYVYNHAFPAACAGCGSLFEAFPRYGANSHSPYVAHRWLHASTASQMSAFSRLAICP